MAAYPRPHFPTTDAPRPQAWAVALVVLSIAGVVNASEVLLIGEELSPMGVLLSMTRNDGLLHAWAVQTGVSPLHIGLASLAVSFVRMGAGISLYRGRSWGAGWEYGLAALGVTLDLACFSPPIHLLAAAMGLWAVVRCRMFR